jgi:hypothetical protein
MLGKIKRRQVTRKEKEILNQYYHQYEGKWNHKLFGFLQKQSGLTIKVINKLFWEKKRKQNFLIQHKMATYPGLIFQITNEKSGKDLTPTFKKIYNGQPIFKIQKVTEPE